MEIKEIKIGELVSFIKSEEFKRLNRKPITELRAVSQFYNPDADPDQTALIYITEGSELLGFAGLLPRKINNSDVTVFSNTCWWVHPEKGRGLAVPLILKAIEKSSFSLYLAESTPQLKAILEKTGKFEFSEAITGVRGFLRFYLADIFSNRFVKLAKFSFLIAWVDFLLNLLTAPFRWYFLKKFERGRLEIESVNSFSKELVEFIWKHGASDFIQKTSESFEWFRKYPWVQVSKNEPPYKYPFTYFVNNFLLEYSVLRKEGEIKAFVAISYRDNLAKIPYIYFDKKYTDEVAKSVLSIILKRKSDSVVVFNPEIVNYIRSHKMPFLFRKKQTKFVGTTKPVYKYFLQNPYIQDGDGDVVFT
jgi:hypothetical protein